MIDVERLKALAALQPEDIRGSEENLKQKFLVPLLEALKHEKRYLDFERPVHGGRLDVFVTGLPKDCKVAVETKRFGEDLDLHLTQIAKYAALEGLLVTVITNGRRNQDL